MRFGQRQSVRLSRHDYSGKAVYFVTLCVQNRECLFGRVVDGKMYLNSIGQIVREEWLHSPQIRSELDLDRWSVMPNHLHGIVRIDPMLSNRTFPRQGQGAPPCAPTLAVKTETPMVIPTRRLR